MLETGSHKAAGRQAEPLTLGRKSHKFDPGRSLDVHLDTRQRQTPFTGKLFAPGLDDDRVYASIMRHPMTPCIQVNDDAPQTNAYLWRGQANPPVSRQGRMHVIEQMTKRWAERGHFTGGLPQHRVVVGQKGAWHTNSLTHGMVVSWNRNRGGG